MKLQAAGRRDQQRVESVSLANTVVDKSICKVVGPRKLAEYVCPPALTIGSFERNHFHFLGLAQGSEIRSGQFAECDGVDAGFDGGAAASATEIGRASCRDRG